MVKIFIIAVAILLIFAGISFLDHGSNNATGGSVCIIMACGLIGLLFMKDKKQ